MERLRRLLESISTQLGVLTVSQRIAIGLCAALIVASVLWLLQWSTTPEMVSLVQYRFTFDDMAGVEDALKENGIAHTVRGTRIYVREVDRHNALRLLHSNGALPDGSLFDMADLMTDQNPFQSPDARAYAQNYAKGNELAKIIATNPVVESASVLINPRTKRRLGGQSDVPSATVAVTLVRGNDMTAERVDGFARLVSGAVAGLRPHNVNITDSRTGRSFSVPHPDDAVPFDYLSIVKRHEDRLQAKIMEKLADIPGIRVTVTVELDTSKKTTQNFLYAEPQPKLESSESSETSESTRPSESGVQANVGTAVTAGSQGASNSSEQTTTENYEPKLSETKTVEQMPFTLQSVTATVGIPRSFIVGVFVARHPEEPDPKDDDADFIAVRDEQTARVKGSVEKIVMAKDPRDVHVDVYPDVEWGADGGGWRQSPGGVAVGPAEPPSQDAIGLLRSYGPLVGLGSLALISMFMMMRMVRRSTDLLDTRHKDDANLGESVDSEGVLTVGPQAIGQAEVSEGLLTGQELDDVTLRQQELSGEVSKMIEDDPGAAADLIRRWVEEPE